MLSVETAEIRVTELQKEASALEAALHALETEQGEHNQKLDAAYIAAERTPTPQNQREAAQVEAHANLLGNQVRRKRVALESCKGDLVVATDNLRRTNLAARVIEFEAYTAELAEICAQLEQNINQPPLWERMTAIFRQGNVLYRQLQPPDSTTIHARTIFIDPGIVLERALAILRFKLSPAIDAKQHAAKVEMTTIAEAAELERLHKAINFERRRHVEPMEQRAPAPEAVPA